jgi:hypothetical protein
MSKTIKHKTQTKYKQNKLKKQFIRREVLEQVIEHLKKDHRIRRNFYNVVSGAAINIILSKI